MTPLHTFKIIIRADAYPARVPYRMTVGLVYVSATVERYEVKGGERIMKIEKQFPPLHGFWTYSEKAPSARDHKSEQLMGVYFIWITKAIDLYFEGALAQGAKGIETFELPIMSGKRNRLI